MEDLKERLHRAEGKTRRPREGGGGRELGKWKAKRKECARVGVRYESLHCARA